MTQSAKSILAALKGVDSLTFVYVDGDAGPLCHVGELRAACNAALAASPAGADSGPTLARRLAEAAWGDDDALTAANSLPNGEKSYAFDADAYIATLERKFAAILASHPAPSAGTLGEEQKIFNALDVAISRAEAAEAAAPPSAGTGEPERVDFVQEVPGGRKAFTSEGVGTAQQILWVSEHDDAARPAYEVLAERYTGLTIGELRRALAASPSLVLPREAVLAEGFAPDYALAARMDQGFVGSAVSVYRNRRECEDHEAADRGAEWIVPVLIIKLSALTVAPARDTE